MKVLHVVDMIDPSAGGGTAERTYQLAAALTRAGVGCSVLCTDVGLTDVRREQLSGVELIAVPSMTRRFLIPRISSADIEKLVREADVVHVMGHWSILGARVCLAALKNKTPYVYCPAGSLRIFGRSALLKRIYNFLIGHRIVRSASRCVSVTALEKEQFYEYGVSDDNIMLLPNGVHPNPDIIPSALDFKTGHKLENKQILLFLGRLSPIKGPDLLLSAFASIAGDYPQSVLVIAGPEDEMGASLKREVEQLGLTGRVFFIGFIAGQDKQNALAAADIMVVPSRQEAMSLVALEAGVCGTPVLLTDQCGFDEVAKAQGGLVVEVSDKAIAEGLRQMLSSGDELLLQGQRLQKLVLERYTWDGISLQVCEVYDELIAAHD